MERVDSAGTGTAKRFVSLAKAAFEKWSADRGSQLGAALAYYAVFAVAPMLIIAVSVAGLVVGDEAAQGLVAENLEDTFGPETSAFIQDLVDNASGGKGAGGAVIGTVLLLIAASALAVQLQKALNVVWDVPLEARKGLRALIRARILGLVTVLGIGLLLTAVVVASSLVAAIESLVGDVSAVVRPFIELGTALTGLVLTAVAFAALFRYLPTATVTWRESAAGGALTAVLFTIGSWLLSRYLGTGSVGSGFGAAAALIVLLVFVYYSAQIVLYGAEFARVYGTAADVPDTAPPVEEPVRPPTPVQAVWAFLIGLAVGWWRKRK